MKQVIAIVFCSLLFAVSFFTGCAGPTSQIKAKDVKAEVAGGTNVPGTAETPAGKASANEKVG
ncbi:MAG: hypothetical protein NTY64_00015, partial [Deltaproteobacteria bacterium]|nr:hypothetical protein [Deltaproteobacteria bacterium]